MGCRLVQISKGETGKAPVGGSLVSTSSLEPKGRAF